jgi:hypothetical protein
MLRIARVGFYETIRKIDRAVLSTQPDISLRHTRASRCHPGSQLMPFQLNLADEAIKKVGKGQLALHLRRLMNKKSGKSRRLRL